MPSPLLQTKLFLPAIRPDLVERPHLTGRLQAGLQHKLTLVSAPAGCGKTTLVSGWLRNCRCPTAWLTLDQDDNDPARFLAYLVAALETLHPGAGRSVRPLLDAPRLPPAGWLMTELINSLVRAPGPLVLVLDDYHTITALGVHELVGLLLAGQPPQLHLVISTRHDPPLPLAQLRARNQLTEIRQSDLRFSTAESVLFLNRSMRLQLAPAEIAALEERTEGWIAGLQLAALSLEGRDAAERSRFIASFSGRHHFVLDYLTDQVLKRQPEPVQELLLRTSILSRFCGPLCDAVMGDDRGLPGGQQILEQLQAANLFIVPLDDERQWFRYHHLFSDLLQARLKERWPEEVAELHRRAAAWHEANQHADEAVRHARATQDPELLAATVERVTLKISTWSQAGVGTLHEWLQSVPAESMHSRPWLRLFTARTLFVRGQWDQATHMLNELEVWLRARPDVADSALMLGRVAADQASQAVVLGDVRQARDYALQALDQIPAGDLIQRMRVMAVLGMAYSRAGELADAHPAFEQAISLALQAGMDLAAVPFLCNLAMVQVDQGRLDDALATCQQAAELGTVAGATIAPAGYIGLVRGTIYYERNQLPEAERCLREGIDLISGGGIAEAFGNLHALLAQIMQAQGDSQAARALIRHALLLAESSSIQRLAIRAAAHQARIWLVCGELEAAAGWAQAYRQIGATEYLREFEELTLARVLLAQDDPTSALALLDSLLAPAQAAGRLGTVIGVQALRGLAWQALGDTGRALSALSQALDLAEPHNFVRTFVDEGAPMAALLRQAAQRGIAPAFVRQLLHALEASVPQTVYLPMQPLPEPLTEREQEVLALLADGLSNTEIARRLVVSLPTVKSHTRNLYGKLGVNSRDQAVERARALGILLPR